MSSYQETSNTPSPNNMLQSQRKSPKALSILGGRLVGGWLGGKPPSAMENSDMLPFDQTSSPPLTPSTASLFARYVLPETAQQQDKQQTKRKVQDHKSMVVRFEENHEYHEVLHRNDYSVREVVNTWYQAHQIKYMRKENREFLATFVVSSFQHNSCNKHENFNEMDDNSDSDSSPIPTSPPLNSEDGPLNTIRGLESKTVMGALRRRRHRMQAKAAVFSEQQLQRMNKGDHCPHIAALAIAEAYLEMAEPCQLAAHMLALRDAKDVQDYLRNDRSMLTNRDYLPDRQDEGSERNQSDNESFGRSNVENIVASSREDSEDLRNESIPRQIIASPSSGRVAAPLGIRDTNQTLSSKSSRILHATYPLTSRRRVTQTAVWL